MIENVIHVKYFEVNCSFSCSMIFCKSQSLISELIRAAPFKKLGAGMFHPELFGPPSQKFLFLAHRFVFNFLVCSRTKIPPTHRTFVDHSYTSG